MRVQLALNVADLDAAIDYYERLFDVTVAKRKPGYANFEIDQPALKLVLFETKDPQDRLNHLGVEVFDTASVARAASGQKDRGLAVAERTDENCCHATQDKAITHAPDGTMWEWYVKKADLDAGDVVADVAAATPRPRVEGRCC